MSDADLPELRFLPGQHRRFASGHPWAFSNEIAMTEAARALPPGGLVRLATAHGAPLALASFNPRTLIAARALGRVPQAGLDPGFIAARLAAARDLRERLYPGGFYRLIHAEADGLPGVIVDRYGDVLALQLNTAGAERLRAPLLEALAALLAPRCIVLRNDSPARRLEGLDIGIETLGDAAAASGIAIAENGAVFVADPASGQKTGWFFDQRENRARVAALAGGARMLDAYCYGGGFGVLAAARGAAAVTLLDRSESALAAAMDAASRNGVASRCTALRGEVFAELARLAEAGARYEIVVADPPAFVKSRKDLGAGARGYRKLARLAAAVVAPGGFLFVASCSHHVDPALFAEQVARGLDDARRTGRILATTGAGADHPVHPHLPESAYLKGQILHLD